MISKPNVIANVIGDYPDVNEYGKLEKYPIKR
jgi:hypothetical protein